MNHNVIVRSALSVRKAITRSKRTWIFLGEKRW
jgi:hypothetical protein